MLISGTQLDADIRPTEADAEMVIGTLRVTLRSNPGLLRRAEALVGLAADALRSQRGGILLRGFKGRWLVGPLTDDSARMWFVCKAAGMRAVREVLRRHECRELAPVLAMDFTKARTPRIAAASLRNSIALARSQAELQGCTYLAAVLHPDVMSVSEDGEVHYRPRDGAPSFFIE